MKLEDIIKTLKEKEVDSDVIDAIKGLDQSDELGKLTKELEAERGKNAGILEDKKKFKERAETAETTLKELQDKDLSVEEKTKKQMDELQQKLEAAEQARQKQENDFKAQQRESKLSDLTGSVKWSSSIPRDTAKLIVKNAFTDMDDLSDQKAIDSKLKEITEAHKAIIDSEAAGGTGSRAAASKGGSDDTPASMSSLMAEVWEKS